MNEQELKEIEDRCNAATPGPWESHYNGNYHEIIANNDDLDCVAEVSAMNRQSDYSNETFIANARTDTPKLIAEVRRLLERSGGCGHSISCKNLQTCASCCRSHARALDAAVAETNGPL